MATTFNPEIANLVRNEGGGVIYSSGNILIVSEISEELYRELLKSPYIESLEVLPLKRYSSRVTSDLTTISVGDETVAFEDLQVEETDTENVSGNASNNTSS